MNEPTVWVEVPATWIHPSGAYTFLADGGRSLGPVLAIEPESPRADIERAVRAQVAAELQRAAAGRTHYAANAPEDTTNRAYLEGEANAFDQAARLAIGDEPGLMCGILPASLWTETEEQAARAGTP